MSAEEQAHELLLRLAGRLPGTLVWRLREWLAAGGQSSVAAVLPRELLRRRVGLTDEERELLIGSAGAWGAKPRLLDAVLPLPAPEEAPVLFAPDPVLDAAALTALAIVKSHPGTLELHQARRGGQRVLVVFGGDDAVAAHRHVAAHPAGSRRPHPVRRGAAEPRSPDRLPPRRRQRVGRAVALPPFGHGRVLTRTRRP